MLGFDRDAVVCDLAETYNVLDYKTLPVMTLATLCAGLHDDSRIKMEIAGLQRISPTFAAIRAADTLTIINYALTAKHGAKLPTLYQDVMTSKQKQKKTTGFSSIEEFENARMRFLNNG
jgi:hypothetical protein